MPEETERLRGLRDQLYARLSSSVAGIQLNGPALDRPNLRLVANLNVSVQGVDGEALMLGMGGLAVSSGSACSSADPEPSHVLRALGLSDQMARGSIRFGLGRFNTQQDVEFAAATVAEAAERLRTISRSMAQ